MKPEIQSLRLVIYACHNPASTGGQDWSGVVELQTELDNGEFKHYVIRPGTRYATRSAAVEAARQTMVNDPMFANPLPPRGDQQPELPASARHVE
jgi:hypothetical protein